MGRHKGKIRFHIDQPSNDFNTLFEVLDADPDRYVLDEPNVFPAAIGRSFYENVLPPGSVYFGWCSYAAVWLSRVPTLIPGHFFSLRSTGTVRAEFDRQSAQDWQTFLSLRARELRLGGRLVVVLPALADDGLTGIEHVMDQANAVLADMVADGAITADERARMVLSSHPRRKRDLLAPFEHDGRFFRSIFMPSLASALASVRSGDAEALRIFGDRLEAGLKARLANRPTAMHSLVQTIVLAKRA